MEKPWQSVTDSHWMSLAIESWKIVILLLVDRLLACRSP